MRMLVRTLMSLPGTPSQPDNCCRRPPGVPVVLDEPDENVSIAWRTNLFTTIF